MTQAGMYLLRRIMPPLAQPLIDYFNLAFQSVSGVVTTGNGTRRPTFPPSVWDVHDITVNNADRTNNFIEAWNRGFQILLSENQLLQEADAAQAASILLKHTIIITTLPNQNDDLRVLGVQLSSDLSLDKHVNVVSAKCFFQLRQLRHIRRSLDDDSVATLVHAFVASRVDYCGSLLIGAPR